MQKKALFYTAIKLHVILRIVQFKYEQSVDENAS